jgi:hypothetical protein
MHAKKHLQARSTSTRCRLHINQYLQAKKSLMALIPWVGLLQSPKNHTGCTGQQKKEKKYGGKKLHLQKDLDNSDGQFLGIK